MKKRYKRDCYLLNEKTLIFGYKDKYGFHSYNKNKCGFATQKIKKRDFGKIVFPLIEDALEKYKDISVYGGKLILSIDYGYYVIKYVYRNSKRVVLNSFKTEEVENENVIPIILRKIGINKYEDLEILYLYYHGAGYSEMGEIIVN